MLIARTITARKNPKKRNFTIVVKRGMIFLVSASEHAVVVERQTRCLQAAVPTRREGSNPSDRTIHNISRSLHR